MKRTMLLIVAVVGLSACPPSAKPAGEADKPKAAEPTSGAESAPAAALEAPVPSDGLPHFGTPVPTGATTEDGKAKALFAGGCFWCMEGPFEQIDGVYAAISGYAGGEEEAPEYKQVATGQTSHTEAVLVLYDAGKVSYEQLLDAFWRSHDPTDGGGQFADRGPQYRPAVFAYDATQRAAAEKSKAGLEASGRFEKPIATPVVDATVFWPAEEYHQNYYQTNTAHYKRYRKGSGREGFLARVWGED